MNITEEKNFISFWESTIKPGISEELISNWRQYNMFGVSRGYEVYELLRPIKKKNAFTLDVGCGFGGTSIAFASSGDTVMAIDLNEERLIGARIRARLDYQLSNINFAFAELERLPFPESMFDCIICQDVFEHVRSQIQSIREISRKLKPGGLAYISFPNYFSCQNLLRDPHYGIFGISVLPKPLAAWYVTRLRQRSPDYEVGYFPIASILKLHFEKQSMRIIWQRPIMQRRFGLATHALQTIRLNTYALVEWILQKNIA